MQERKRFPIAVLPILGEPSAAIEPGKRALSGEELARCRTLRLGPFPVPPHKNCS